MRCPECNSRTEGGFDSHGAHIIRCDECGWLEVDEDAGRGDWEHARQKDWELDRERN